MSVRMRHTRAHTANRRSHHALKSPRLSVCSKCSAMHLRHRMCVQCGSYKGREVIDVLSKIQKKSDKKEKKAKAYGAPKEDAANEKEESKTKKLDPAVLSK